MSEATRRYKDRIIRYTSDVGRDYIFSQRTYTNPNTPITPLLTAREITTNEKPPRSKPFEARKSVACFLSSNNRQGFSERSVIIPYAPVDDLFMEHIKEIANVQGVETQRYTGETHTTNTGAFL